MRRYMTTRVTPALLLLATFVLLAVQQGAFKPSSSTPVRDAGMAGTRGTLALGVTTGPLARNWWRAWTASDLSSVDTFEGDAGKAARIVMWYADWQHNHSPSISQLNLIRQRGSIPEITWEPWDASKNLYQSQPRYRLANIIDGKFDGYIRTWARSLARWHNTVLLRFAQEGDGNWFPWTAYGNGNQPDQYVQAWRHVHRIFTAAGATNVKWVWSPAFARSPQTFPGTGYVNIMATTCQNADKQIFARGWQSFQADCGGAIARLHALRSQATDPARRSRQRRAGRQQGPMDPPDVRLPRPPSRGHQPRLVQRAKRRRLADPKLAVGGASLRRRTTLAADPLTSSGRREAPSCPFSHFWPLSTRAAHASGPGRIEAAGPGCDAFGA